MLARVLSSPMLGKYASSLPRRKSSVLVSAVALSSIHENLSAVVNSNPNPSPEPWSKPPITPFTYFGPSLIAA